MVGTLPDAVRLRPKSPLAGDPAVEQVRVAARHPIDDFVPIPDWRTTRSAMPFRAWPARRDSERLSLNVRPYTLNRWLGNATACLPEPVVNGEHRNAGTLLASACKC